MLSIVTRKVEPTDHAFIFATALNNKWYDKENKSTLEKATWMRLMHGRLEGLLNDSKAVVACLSDDSDVIVGYVLCDKDLFVYIKKAWRSPELNLTKMLLKEYEESK